MIAQLNGHFVRNQKYLFHKHRYSMIINNSNYFVIGVFNTYKIRIVKYSNAS